MNRPKWLIPVGIIVAALLVIVVPLVGSYNNLVEQESKVDQSFADLDVQLQRRNDLIPNLVSSARAVLKQEQTVFIEVARARAAYADAGSLQEKAAANQQVESALRSFVVLVQQQPELKSSETIQDLMTQLEGTENRVAQGRREYNEVTTDYNVYVKRFPRRIIAGMFGYDPKPLFTAPPEARNAPDANLDDAFSTPAP